MKRKRKAFTLIELLVVVLIIGVLSAVALPQYQKAVWKAHAAQIMSLVRSIANAQEIYYLANGEYSSTFSALDIQLPAEPEESCHYNALDCRKVGDWDLLLWYSGASVEAEYKNIIRITSYFEHKKSGNSIRQQSGNLVCVALNTTKGVPLCKTLGTQIQNTEYYRIE